MLRLWAQPLLRLSAEPATLESQQLPAVSWCEHVPAAEWTETATSLPPQRLQGDRWH